MTNNPGSFPVLPLGEHQRTFFVGRARSLFYAQAIGFSTDVISLVCGAGGRKMTYNFGIAIVEDVIKMIRYTYVWYESIEALDYIEDIEEYRLIIKPKEITQDTLERGFHY